MQRVQGEPPSRSVRHASTIASIDHTYLPSRRPMEMWCVPQSGWEVGLGDVVRVKSYLWDTHAMTRWEVWAEESLADMEIVIEMNMRHAVELLWPYLADPEKWPEWIPALVERIRIDDGPLQAGHPGSRSIVWVRFVSGSLTG